MIHQRGLLGGIFLNALHDVEVRHGERLEIRLACHALIELVHQSSFEVGDGLLAFPSTPCTAEHMAPGEHGHKHGAAERALQHGIHHVFGRGSGLKNGVSTFINGFKRGVCDDGFAHADSEVACLLHAGERNAKCGLHDAEALVFGGKFGGIGSESTTSAGNGGARGGKAGGFVRQGIQRGLHDAGGLGANGGERGLDGGSKPLLGADLCAFDGCTFGSAHNGSGEQAGGNV